MIRQIKDLLAEIERAKEKAIKEWMETGSSNIAAQRIGEKETFEFVIDRLKSILAAMKDES